MVKPQQLHLNHHLPLAPVMQLVAQLMADLMKFLALFQLLQNTILTMKEILSQQPNSLLEQLDKILTLKSLPSTMLRPLSQVITEIQSQLIMSS